jgi:rSAM/selenodomain-associated transferase 2
MRLSVIIPVLNEASTIDQTLSRVLSAVQPEELIVVDGGSTDGTAALAARPGVRVINAPRGRGTQMHAGALVSTGDALLFLHADTLPPDAAGEEIAAALSDPRTVGGNFEIIFVGDFASARFLTFVYHYLALIGLRYGDSGYFVRRIDYDAVDGFRPYPILEDLDLMRRLRKRGLFVRVDGQVKTSARRFQGRWFALVFARWTFMQVLYWLGVSPIWLGRFYHHVRLPGKAWRREADQQSKAEEYARAPEQAG